MAAILHKIEQRRLIDSDGIADGASIAFYLTGTLTPTTVYTSSSLATPLANPVVVGAGAQVPDIYLDSSITYRRIITYLDGTVDDTDPYISSYTAGSIAFTQTGTGAVTRTSQSKLAERVSITDFGAVADWNGATGTDNTAAIQAACDTGAHNVYVPQGKFKFTNTIFLRTGQQLVGDSSALYTASSSTPQSLLAFRPAIGGKVGIKNAVGTNGQGVRAIGLDLNDATNYGMQFTTTYGIVVDEAQFYGTFDIGILMDDVYICRLDNVVMGTGCSVKRAGILIGTSNGVRISNFHSSIVPNAVGTCARGIAIHGGGSGKGYWIDNPALQGWTIGIDVGGGVGNLNALGVYTENTVCSARVGSGITAALGTNLQGNWSGPYSGHIQYAARGPIIYAPAFTALRIKTGRFDNTPDSTNGVNRAWSILCGAGALTLAVEQQSVFGNTIDRDLVMREAAGNSPSVDMTSLYGANGAREIILKKDGAFASTHYGLRIDTAGAVSTVVWAPAVIAGTVDPLLTAAMPVPSAILL